MGQIFSWAYLLNLLNPCAGKMLNIRFHHFAKTSTMSVEKQSPLAANGLLIIALFCVALSFWAFKPARMEGKAVFMQVTTIESIIPGGTGRSRMFTTEMSGQQQEFVMENFYSMVGINMKNIQLNERLIVEKLNAYANEGWQVVSVTTGVQSPSEGNSQGIFLTRYLLSKTVD